MAGVGVLRLAADKNHVREEGVVLQSWTVDAVGTKAGRAAYQEALWRGVAISCQKKGEASPRPETEFI